MIYLYENIFKGNFRPSDDGISAFINSIQMPRDPFKFIKTKIAAKEKKIVTKRSDKKSRITVVL